MDKILVCITPQSNSRRLIDRAAKETASRNGELHILNIQKGDNIFFDENSAEMLQELFNYGSKMGGIVHALAGDDIPSLIMNFVSKHEITEIIVGEPPKSALKGKNASVIEKLSRKLTGIEILVVEREAH